MLDKLIADAFLRKIGPKAPTIVAKITKPIDHNCVFILSCLLR